MCLNIIQLMNLIPRNNHLQLLKNNNKYLINQILLKINNLLFKVNHLLNLLKIKHLIIYKISHLSKLNFLEQSHIAK